MRRRVDLHIHTNASDGTWGNEELLEAVLLAGIDIFAITDHDSIDNAIALAKKKIPDTLTFVMGAEIACVKDDLRFHIAAYGFDPEDAGLKSLLRENCEATDHWLMEIVKKLSRSWKNLSVKEFEGYLPVNGGSKATNYLLEKGVLKTPTDFFAVTNASGIAPGYGRAEKVIDTIRAAGGYSFLAHPQGYVKGVRMEWEKLKEWVGLGIDGIECYHPSIKDQESFAYYVDFCREAGLMISGGSDTHGTFVPERQIGVPVVYRDMLRLDFIK